MTEPLPCPFCGSQPTKHLIPTQADKVYMVLSCYNEECPCETVFVDGGYLVNPTQEQIDATFEAMVKTWNTRYEPARSSEDEG